MKLLKPQNNQSIDRTKPTPADKISFVTDDRAKFVIPIGPRFQVDVPSWNPSSSKSRLTTDDTESDSSKKWLGTPVWPPKGRSQDMYHGMVGKGRPRACICAFPGSIECVRRHVSEKRLQLKIDLGSAFWKWRFDVMGEDVSKVWNQEEQRKFTYIVKKNLTSHDTSFVKSASQCFPCQSKGSIISYYLNVYIPRRMSVQTRSSCITIDTDDDDDDDGDDILHSKGSRKRLQADFASSSRKYMKTAYLTSCR